MRIFLLEDDPGRVAWFIKNWGKDNVDHADRVVLAAGFLRANEYDIIFLDHDILPGTQMVVDDNVESGRDLARIMAEEKLGVDTPVVVHSLNDVGANLILEILSETHNKLNRINFVKLRYDMGKDGLIRSI